MISFTCQCFKWKVSSSAAHKLNSVDMQVEMKMDNCCFVCAHVNIQTHLPSLFTNDTVGYNDSGPAEARREQTKERIEETGLTNWRGVSWKGRERKKNRDQPEIRYDDCVVTNNTILTSLVTWKWWKYNNVHGSSYNQNVFSVALKETFASAVWPNHLVWQVPSPLCICHVCWFMSSMRDLFNNSQRLLVFSSCVPLTCWRTFICDWDGPPDFRKYVSLQEALEDLRLWRIMPRLKAPPVRRAEQLQNI